MRDGRSRPASEPEELTRVRLPETGVTDPHVGVTADVVIALEAVLDVEEL